MTLIFESFSESELNASPHKSSPNMATIMQADRQTCNSPPHERVDVFFHHAVQRQPHPVPPSVEHVVTSSHQPAAERTTLTQREDVSTLISAYTGSQIITDTEGSAHAHGLWVVWRIMVQRLLCLFGEVGLSFVAGQTRVSAASLPAGRRFRRRRSGGGAEQDGTDAARHSDE